MAVFLGPVLCCLGEALDVLAFHQLKIVFGVDLLVCDKVVNSRMTVDTAASKELMDEKYSGDKVFITGNKVHNMGVYPYVINLILGCFLLAATLLTDCLFLEADCFPHHPEGFSHLVHISYYNIQL